MPDGTILGDLLSYVDAHFPSVATAARAQGPTSGTINQEHVPIALRATRTTARVTNGILSISGCSIKFIPPPPGRDGHPSTTHQTTGPTHLLANNAHRIEPDQSIPSGGDNHCEDDGRQKRHRENESRSEESAQATKAARQDQGLPNSPTLPTVSPSPTDSPTANTTAVVRTPEEPIGLSTEASTTNGQQPATNTNTNTGHDCSAGSSATEASPTAAPPLGFEGTNLQRRKILAKLLLILGSDTPSQDVVDGLAPMINEIWTDDGVKSHMKQGGRLDTLKHALLTWVDMHTRLVEFRRAAGLDLIEDAQHETDWHNESMVMGGYNELGTWRCEMMKEGQWVDEQSFDYDLATFFARLIDVQRCSAESLAKGFALYNKQLLDFFI